MKKSMLFTTIAMIVVVVVALSTATFAWFSAQGQAAINGTVEITSSRDFIIKEYGSSWEPVDKIELGAAAVVPASFVADPMKTGQYLINPGATVNDPVETNSTTNDFYTMTTAADGFGTPKICGSAERTIKSFQIQNGTASTIATPKAIIKIGCTDKNDAGAHAISSMRVLLQVTKYGDQAVTTFTGTATQWGAVTRNSADPATVETIVSGGDVASEKYNPVDTAYDGGGTNSLSAIEVLTSGSFITSSTNATVPDTAGKYNHTTQEVVGQDNSGYYNVLVQNLPEMTAGEVFTVTAYIWLDGTVVKDSASAKNVSIQIKLDKGV